MIKYLAMGLTFDPKTKLSGEESFLNLRIYIATNSSQFSVLNNNQTFQQVKETFWRVSFLKLPDIVLISLSFEIVLFIFLDKQTHGHLLFVEKIITNHQNKYYFLELRILRAQI